VRGRPLLISLLVAVATAGSGCAFLPAGGDEGSATENRETPRVGTVTVRDSRFGRILFDGRGFVLYAFTKDGRGVSDCYGACAEAWPPYLVQGEPAAGAGARAGLVGTTRRRDGTRQLTYAGRPVYYYVGDRAPGQILCQDVLEFGGRWLVVDAGGALVQ
jgi:predicted lipoprotein with Yx(FWY)xxD motif